MIIIQDTILNFIRKMQDSTDYLGMDELEDQYSYKIYARNAYAGVWLKGKNGFLISRYKIGPRPYLFIEYHWDTGEPLGTVKPLGLIEKCPFEIKENYNDIEKQKMLGYLDKLEENNPVVNGVNSLQNRKMAAIAFEQRLAAQSRKPRKRRVYQQHF